MILLTAAAFVAAGAIVREQRRGNSKPARTATAVAVGFLVWVAAGILIARERDLESMRDIWTVALLALIPAILVPILGFLAFRLR